MKKHLTTIILICILLVGLSLLLYPSFSDYWNSFHQSRAISSYAEQVATLDEDRYLEVWQAAEAYNINKRTLDVTKLLQKGTNEILVEVSSTLNNRLLQRGFYATAMEKSNRLRLKAGNETPDKFVHEPIKTRVRDYGLVGKSFLRLYQ